MGYSTDHRLSGRGSSSVVMAIFVTLLGVACANATPYGSDGAALSAGERPSGGSGDVMDSASLPDDEAVVQLTQVQPPSLRAATGDVAVAITGTGFTPESIVMVGNVAVQTKVSSATSLTATIPAAHLAQAGTMTLSVVTGASASNALNVLVVAGPALTGLTPRNAPTRVASATPLALNLTGTGFDASSVVVFNGVDIATQLASPNALNATVPTNLLAVPGAVNITVRSGGAQSSPVGFTITDGSASTAGTVCGGGSTCAQLGLLALECDDLGGGPLQCETDGCVYEGCF